MGLFTSLRRKVHSSTGRPERASSSPPTSSSNASLPEQTTSASTSVTSLPQRSSPASSSVATLPQQSSPASSSTSLLPQQQAPPSPRVAPLLVTVGPTVLRSNLPRGRSSRSSSRTCSPKRRRKSSKSVRSTTVSSLARPMTPQADSSTSTSTSTTSATSSPSPTTPLELTSLTESPAAFETALPVQPRSPSRDWTSRAPALLSKPAFSPALSPVVSPTASCFAGDIGGATASPTFSYFAASPASTSSRRSSTWTKRSPARASTALDTCNTIMLNSPVMDHHQHSSPSSPRSPAVAAVAGPSRPARLVDRRPFKLDLSAATRRPRPRGQLTDLDSAIPSSPVVAFLKETLAAAATIPKPPRSPNQSRPFDLAAMSTSLNELEVSLRSLLETSRRPGDAVPRDKPVASPT